MADKPETSPRVAMRLGDAGPAIDARADREISNETRADAIRRMVERYDWVTDADRPKFTVAEWKLVCNALNASLFQSAAQLRTIWAVITDTIKIDRLDKKWDVNGASLIKKFRELTPGQLVATIDVVERFWIETRRGNPHVKVPGEIIAPVAVEVPR